MYPFTCSFVSLSKSLTLTLSPPNSLSQGPSATIKTHHNVGGLPASMHLKLLEPLRELFKDEVRHSPNKYSLLISIITIHLHHTLRI